MKRATPPALALLALLWGIPASADGCSGLGNYAELCRGIAGLAQLGYDKSQEVRHQAMDFYVAAERKGSCASRHKALLDALPRADAYARMSKAIYAANPVAGQVAVVGQRALTDETGRFYAEVLEEPGKRAATVVFRGTRLGSQADIAANVANFFGVEGRYYGWAANLVSAVAAANPGWVVTTTGHSLGGGLAIHAAAQNPGVRAIAFNPAGMNANAWRALPAADRDRLARDVEVFATRSTQRVDPVAALSLAGRSVLPGRVRVLPHEAADPVSLHSMDAMLAALRAAANTRPGDAICDSDLGVIAPPA